jgi:hypothetical protein
MGENITINSIEKFPKKLLTKSNYTCIIVYNYSSKQEEELL